MKIPSVLKLTGVLLAGLCCFNTALAATQEPNIVLILTDDQPYGYLGATGNKIVETPNIDKLAEQGVLFTNAHVSSAICTPSRISLLLGQYERRHGVNFNSATAVSAEAWSNSYPVKMREAGYYTGWVGKNHSPVGEQGYGTGLMEKSFDYWYAGNGHIYFYPKEKHPIFSEAESDTQVEIVEEGMMDFLNSNEHKFDKALKFLDRRPQDKPFMLSINFNLPHGAGTSNMKMRPTDDEIYRTKYRDIDLPLPENYIAKADIKKPKLPADLLRAEDRQAGYNYSDTPAALKERYTRQLQAMTGIDRLVGHLKEELEKQGIADNTVIIFTSDHGLFMGEQGLGGKALCYEKTTHVPLIVYDPRVEKQGTTSQALVQSIDIAPTMLKLAGIQVPNTMQGEDIREVIYQGKDAKREYVFTENLWSTHFGNPRCEAIQDHKWKYIRYYENNNMSATQKIAIAKEMGIPVNKILYGMHDNDIVVYRNYLGAGLKGEPAVYEELYDLTNDPNELHNLVNESSHSNKLAQMRKDWYPILKEARGTGSPKVVRYTVDSQVETGKEAKTY
ncbi:sulfatase-like hydrolase/transferase [Paraglaciecola aquimarina]|uniref:Sulfatase-like hydrolase/transferase n=1 Tax=Paraglaciecola aquimarina TaxID=1235557 RepID=A0ABU3SYP9_9ALTE|nr:sulfatase-like hydrolase/transferase [Paraglaciecola aquimarina]MDU0355139.1 sulfatase-like hydrolase/transferase [Paraglaciecola aquimarina]